MKINTPLVDRLAALARLEFDEASKEKIKEDLEEIIIFVEKLKEVDTSGIEPLTYLSEDTNVFRKDEVQQDITRTEALKNAPVKTESFFKVPKVIRKEQS